MKCELTPITPEEFSTRRTNFTIFINEVSLKEGVQTSDNRGNVYL
jgi:hypothetical protein